MPRHAIIYVPGLGDTTTRGRKLAVRLWRLYGVRAVVHQMVWADGESYRPKIASLLRHIDELVQDGYTVSLVGESAGASAALNAFAERSQSIHRVIFVCGKLRSPQTIHPLTYRRNPAFSESMAAIPASLEKLSADDRKRLRSLGPIRDQVVPPGDTYIDDVELKTILSAGHAFSIILCLTLYSWWVVHYLKKP